MKYFIHLAILIVLNFFPLLAVLAQEPQPLAMPDERFKTDILLVVAHPEDEGAATPYLARAMDAGKRVAVVYGTRGSSGGNEVGSEQAGALGLIREVEAHHALATLGISNVWFLPGRDTASQNVLQSLANWGHGVALEQLVHLVRLTRPEVVLTFLPGTFIGEDHGDHQAAGVLATEAFDLAGDPAAYPEQLGGPTKRLEPFLENLRPWQSKKIYYFSDADNEDNFHGKGPEYSVKEISKSKNQAYWRMALESFRSHQTQNKSMFEALGKLNDAQIEKMATSEGGWTDGQHFVLGKSHVGGTVTGDIFENITPGSLAFTPAAIVAESARPELAVELAGAWSFYGDFRRTHGLMHLPHPEPPEIALQAPGTVMIPLWLRNQTASAQTITLAVDVPAGWTLQSGAGKFSVASKQVAAARIEVNFPALEGIAAKSKQLQEVTVRSEANGQNIGVVKLRIQLRKRALPQ